MPTWEVIAKQGNVERVVQGERQQVVPMDPLRYSPPRNQGNARSIHDWLGRSIDNADRLHCQTVSRREMR